MEKKNKKKKNNKKIKKKVGKEREKILGSIYIRKDD